MTPEHPFEPPPFRHPNRIASAAPHTVCDPSSSSPQQLSPDPAASPHSSRFDDLVATNFPVHALPSVLQGPVGELISVFGHEAAIPATCGIATASAALGKMLHLRHPKYGQTPANLFILGVASSGQYKTTTFEWMYAPIKMKEAELRNNYNLNLFPTLASRKKGLEAEIRALTTGKRKRSLEEVTAELVPLNRELLKIEKLLVLPSLLIEDATSEGIVRTFKYGNGTLALFSDDGRKVISVICGAYKKGSDQTDEELFLKAYSVSDVRVDRAKNEPVFIEKACLAALILVQPDKFQQVISIDSLVEGGFLQRFLLFSTHSEPLLWSDKQPQICPAAFTAYYDRIRELLDAYRCRGGEPRYVNLTTEASTELINFRNDVVKNRRSQYSHGFASFVDRWAENWCRLALVLHALEHGNKAHDVELPAATAAAATIVMNWFIDQQLSLLTGVREKQEAAQRSRILELLTRRGPLSTRSICQSKLVANKAQADRLLNHLEAESYVMRQPGTDVWMIIPA